eukprot:Amastigsp_a508706_4.p3 type:complete len:150 gc:universal Amastigsp_a508706_4:1253-804(-)
MADVDDRNAGWKMILTLSSGRLKSWHWRSCLRIGSLASSTIECVVIGGSVSRWSESSRCLRSTVSCSVMSSRGSMSRPLMSDSKSRDDISSLILAQSLRVSRMSDWALSDSTLYEIVLARVTMKATTVIGEPSSRRRALSRASASMNIS